MNILIVGGAGYIGSTSAKYLLEQGHTVFVVDDLSTSKEKYIPKGIKYLICNMSSPEVGQFILDNKIDSILLTAGYIQVGESVQDPRKYYENNIGNTLRLFDSILKSNVKKIVFSSSCAVNGVPKKLPIDEKIEVNPINPYGYSKMVVEQILADYGRAYGLDYTIFRYFNACGSYGGHGENHDPETHLIPNILRTAKGLQPLLEIYGNDYATKDGTTIRDFIHVRDLAKAHTIALTTKTPSHTYCLGTGKGYSLYEIIRMCEDITGKKIPTILKERRIGDPHSLYADPTLAQQELTWTAEYSTLEKIIRDSLEHLETKK